MLAAFFTSAFRHHLRLVELSPPVKPTDPHSTQPRSAPNAAFYPSPPIHCHHQAGTISHHIPARTGLVGFRVVLLLALAAHLEKHPGHCRRRCRRRRRRRASAPNRRHWRDADPPQRRSPHQGRAGGQHRRAETHCRGGEEAEERSRRRRFLHSAGDRGPSGALAGCHGNTTGGGGEKGSRRRGRGKRGYPNGGRGRGGSSEGKRTI